MGYLRNKKDDRVMHFDIIAPSEVKDIAVIHNYGKQYLKSKDQPDQQLTSKECSFCHIETVEASRQEEIEKNGYFIIELENCD